MDHIWAAPFFFFFEPIKGLDLRVLAYHFKDTFVAGHQIFQAVYDDDTHAHDKYVSSFGILWYYMDSSSPLCYFVIFLTHINPLAHQYDKAHVNVVLFSLGLYITWTSRMIGRSNTRDEKEDGKKYILRSIERGLTKDRRGGWVE